MDLINKMVSNGNLHQRCVLHLPDLFYLIAVPQGQTAFDVADEDVLGYLEELQKKQNLVSGRNLRTPSFLCETRSVLFSLFQLMSDKKDGKKSHLIETKTPVDNNQSLKPLKR